MRRTLRHLGGEQGGEGDASALGGEAGGEKEEARELQEGRGVVYGEVGEGKRKTGAGLLGGKGGALWGRRAQ